MSVADGSPGPKEGVMTSQAWLQQSRLVAAEAGTDLTRGLTAAEATSRLVQHGANVLDRGPPAPAWRRLLAQFADPLVYLLLVAVTISLATWALESAEGVPFESVTIASILLANAVLGFIQEARAQRAVAALQRMAAPTSRVLRDGLERDIASAEVVPGDVMLLAEGTAVGADARLVEIASLTVAEAALTGESVPVEKNVATLHGDVALADRTNMVFAGTAVTRGRGRAVVTATGMATEMGRIAALLERTAEEPTPLQREIARLGRTLAIAVVGIALVVVVAIVATSDLRGARDVVDVLLVGVSLAVAAVPEGLPVVLSVVLALGVQRMARQHAIVKRLSSVETLGSASVICSDKTGTLTRNEMTVRRIVTHSGQVAITGSGYVPDGELRVDGHLLGSGPLREEVNVVLRGGALANDAALLEDSDGWSVHGDPTEIALLVAARKAGFRPEDDRRARRVGELPFSSERKLMSTLQAADDDEVAVVVKGAPDVLLTRCTHELVGGDAQPLSDHRRTAILATVDGLADDALRTLGVAFRLLPVAPNGNDPHDLERELVFAGVAGIIDPPRVEARAAIADARRAGIRVVMITGDHPRTAGRIAAELGIVDPGARVITGPELDRLDQAAFTEMVRDVSVYARVAPEHKLLIVDALQARDEIVAMTGDGVNDAPALKSADIGIAMGLTGTEVTKEASTMILADDNFATIVAAVREGRAIFADIRTFLRYLLSSNMGEVLTMLLGVLGASVIGLHQAGGAAVVPLLATQILWINLLTDTGPALALGVDPPPEDVMARPPRRLHERVIDAAMQRGVAVVGLVMALATLLVLDLRLPGGLIEGTGTLDEARTAAFTTLVLAQLFNCLNARSDRVSAFQRLFTNPLLWAAIALSALLQVAVVHVGLLNRAFNTVPLDLREWLLCLAMGSTVLWADELRKLAIRLRSATRRGRAAARAA